MIYLYNNKKTSDNQKKYLEKAIRQLQKIQQHQEYIDNSNSIDEDESLDDGIQNIICWLTKNNQLIPKVFMIDLNIKNDSQISLKEFIQLYQMPIPHEWQDENKMSIFDQAYFGIIPNVKGHKSNEQDSDGFTVAMLLAYNNIKIPKCWRHDPKIQNKYGNTVAIIQSQHYKIPDKCWCHTPQLFNKRGDIVCEYLLIGGIIPLQKWFYNISDYKLDEIIHYKLLQNINKIMPKYILDIYQNNQNFAHQVSGYAAPKFQSCEITNPTIFDQAMNKQIPDITGHKPDEQNQDGFTVAMILAFQNIKIPECWYHRSDLTNKYGQTVAIIQALNGEKPDKQWQHDKYYRVLNQNKSGKKEYNTVQDILENQYISVPKSWICNDIYEGGLNLPMIQAYHGQIPQIRNYNPEYQNVYGETVATILAQKDIIPPREWMHSDKIKTINEQCLSDILRQIWLPVPQHWKQNEQLSIFDQACFGEIPDIEGHTADEQNEDGFTVAMILAINEIDIPEQWYHEPSIQNKYGMTVALIISYYQDRIPEEQWNHNPSIADIYGSTVAMHLAYCDIVAPQQWEHDPALHDENDQTVAVLLALNGKIPPKQWEHDYNFRNKSNNTVGMILAQNGIVPPKQWMNDVNMKNNRGESISSYLYQYNYIYQGDQFIPNCQSYVLNQICQICFSDEQQEFVKTTCGHKICMECFTNLLQTQQSNRCPICREYQWFEKIQDEFQYDDEEYSI